MTDKKQFLKSYGFSLLLLVSISIGAVLGFCLKGSAVVLKPLGDVFLNLLFTTVVPLVFFSISSSVASMGDRKRLGRIMGWMMLIFIGTGIVSSVLMVAGVMCYPPASGVRLDLLPPPPAETFNVSEQIVRAFTVADFRDLLSKKNMLALIVFAILVGLAASLSGEKARPFTQFLAAGNEVMGRLIRLIMLYAPVGLGAYFAYLVGVFGPELMGSYLRAMALYYPLAIGYFVAAFSLYAFLAGGGRGVRTFWTNIIPAAFTALGTGSSVATIPTNLEAARKTGVPEDIREIVIPIGATIHMDGSCLAAILKIAFLFGIFNMDFSGPGTIVTAIGIALLSGTVMSGIPGGGFIGEILIVTLYGFPPEALPVISMIGTLVDPPATMVNAAGDNVASMLVARVMEGRNWMKKDLGGQ
ncbi:MAG: dicarboxylate/amino acid:cation symporter [Candidatus Omnitrophota bacterium]|nr:dicarboxylate/amino acid:cation symporter [Candidatus Omnitrophota bacterium]MDZ4242242.1 dicarboxylate/amino acid:cation symporter [Candidatus Omnitrophota bacterium]